jgi:hypothetical protein
MFQPVACATYFIHASPVIRLTRPMLWGVQVTEPGEGLSHCIRPRNMGWKMYRMERLVTVTRTTHATEIVMSKSKSGR